MSNSIKGLNIREPKYLLVVKRYDKKDNNISIFCNTKEQAFSKYQEYKYLLPDTYLYELSPELTQEFIEQGV